MKKFWALVFIFVFLIFPIDIYAMQAPLESKGSSVYLSDNSDVSLVSYLAFLRVRTGFTSVNTSMVLKNQNTEEPVTFLMGIPTQLDSVTSIRDLSVVSNNQKIKYYQKQNLQDLSNQNSTNINKWYVWEITLEPNENRVIECAFSMDNKTDLDGTKNVDIPLRLLESWAGEIGNVQIIADLDFYPPYVFEPNPSIIPLEYDNDGRLTWRFKDINSFASDLNVFFRPIENIVINYLKNKMPSNKDILTILDLFESKNYHKTIQEINEVLSQSYETESEVTSISTELEFIQALCYEKLYQLDKALEIFNKIENSPGFGEIISNTIRNKIIYDKTLILKDFYNDEEKALTYLEEVKNSIKNNEVFLIWVNDEIKQLTPEPPEPEEIEEEPVLDNQEETPNDNNQNIKTVDSVDIFGYKLSIELFLGAIILIIIIILIIRSNIRKRRKRYSIFK